MNYDKGSQRQRKSDCESFFIYNLLITTLKYNSFIYKKLINTINHTCAISSLLKKLPHSRVIAFLELIIIQINNSHHDKYMNIPNIHYVLLSTDITCRLQDYNNFPLKRKIYLNCALCTDNCALTYGPFLQSSIGPIFLFIIE